MASSTFESLFGGGIDPQLKRMVALSALAHLSRASVAEVRVVRPQDDLRLPALFFEMRYQRMQRFRHVAVAQIPG